ncbi:G-protein coupled receptor Mth-like isoform X2 [Spodoptera litura]|uniref:G-protein coupled receptor Mth-like isoform X2 n=1 Tax=Spodoptera litura TaxID=69820 RepID=A0A9J7IPD1_SPOLT|nr:G-protein coupled receptor Mth-like isoform X2 [Spodoptera litura]
MHLLIVMSVIVYASADIVQGDKVFRKCCPNNQSLMKVFDDESFNFSSTYKCLDRESARNDYNITIIPLFVGKNVSVEYGIPEICDDFPIQEISVIDLNSAVVFNGCYDRLVAELHNDTVKTIIPLIVGLKSCVENEDNKTSANALTIHNYRKCCPRGQSYDSNFHICRDTEVNNSEEWLLKRLKMKDNFIYEVDTGLHCETDEYSIELRQRFFSLQVDGSTLKIFSKKGDGSGDAVPGQWCVDREFSSSELVARVCSSDCSKYGAFCVRKCCPIGYHYKPRRCGSFASKCVPNVDDVLFNISDYMEPLQHKNPEITDVMGFRIDLHCNAGRVVLNKSVERDRHRLRSDGRLISPISVGDGYCFEAFDSRFCPDGNIFITAVNCFIKAPEVVKNFQVSFFLISISSVCLALTLLVYISLPELRNLHGRTLICHVSMMLLAFGCLARAQHSRVADNTTCTLIGYGIYFGFVAAFAWLNVMCFDIWWTFGSVRSVQPMRKANTELRRFLWYSLYAWSTAILLTLVMFIFDKYPVSDYLDANMGEGLCWFGTYQNARNDWPHYIYFVIPMGLVTCTNFVLWVLTARHCARVKSEVHRLQAGSVGDRVKRRFRVDRAKYVLTGKLWIVMGAGWISELMSTIVSQPWWLWTIIDLINELQGVFIFLILVMKPKLYYLIRKRLGLEKPDAQKNGTSSSARTSSTFLSRALSTDERTNTRLSLQNNVKQP